MRRFLQGHATHPDWRIALALAAAQIEAQRHQPGHASEPTLGWVYISDAYAAHAEAMLAELRQRWPGVGWVGASGVGVAATGVEYFAEPALALMLAELPREQFRVFSGVQPLRDFAAHTAQVHADPATPELGELVDEMSRRTTTGYLFGGLASTQLSEGAGSAALHIADAVLRGGLSGVALAEGVGLVSRVTQGCQPSGPTRRISAAEGNVVFALDGEPALDCLLKDLEIAGAPQAALPRLRQTLVGLSDPAATEPGATTADAAIEGRFDRTPQRGALGAETRVRHLIGLDPGRRGIAIADHAEVGSLLTFCHRNAEAARRDLVRICAEVREEVESEVATQGAALARKSAAGAEPAPAPGGMAGAVYVSCAGRGGPHFGAPSAELAIVRHALGDVPLVGFFAAGEIARQNLYGYTGVLTVFRAA